MFTFFFLNFDALTHLQPLACIAELQLRGRDGDGLHITGTARKGGNGFEMGEDGPGSHGYGAGTGLEAMGMGIGQGWGSTFVPVQFHRDRITTYPPPSNSAFAFLIYSILLLLDVVVGLFFKRLLYFTLGLSPPSIEEPLRTTAGV